MALDKTSLEKSIKDLLNANTGDTEGNRTTKTTAATLATAIETFVKTATVKVNIPIGAVTQGAGAASVVSCNSQDLT